MASAPQNPVVKNDWIVLGDPGISFGPMPQREAEAFAARGYGRIALSLDGARSQIETCARYGLSFKPRQLQSTAPQSAPKEGSS